MLIDQHLSGRLAFEAAEAQKKAAEAEDKQQQAISGYISPATVVGGGILYIPSSIVSGTDAVGQFLGLWYGPTAPASAVKRFSDGPDSPWRDETFHDARGYAAATQAPPGGLGYAAAAPAPAGGSGRLPGLRTDPRAPWSAWADGVFTSFDRGGAAATDGHILNFMGGVDYRLTERFIAGGALGYEDQRFNTSFNSGHLGGRGPTLAAYAGYLLSPQLSVMATVTAGVAFLNYDVRDSGASGSYDAQRLFVSASLSRNWYSGRWRVTPRADLFYASERRDGFNFSDGSSQAGATVNIGRLSAGPEVGYLILTSQRRSTVEPTAFFALDCDLTRQNSIVGANGIVVTDNACGGRAGAGLNVVRPLLGLSSSLGFSYNSLFRSDQDSWTFTGRIAKEF
jgi:outer membrane autotransporter protein